MMQKEVAFQKCSSSFLAFVVCSLQGASRRTERRLSRAAQDPEAALQGWQCARRPELLPTAVSPPKTPGRILAVSPTAAHRTSLGSAFWCIHASQIMAW